MSHPTILECPNTTDWSPVLMHAKQLAVSLNFPITVRFYAYHLKEEASIPQFMCIEHEIEVANGIASVTSVRITNAKLP